MITSFSYQAPSVLTAQSTFAEVQDHLNRIYRVHNDRLFTPHDIYTNMARAATIIAKKVRKKQLQNLNTKMAKTLAWALAIASRLHIDLGHELLWHFPNVCPYSGTKPHRSREGKSAGRLDLTEFRRDLQPQTISEAQTMLREIYPANTLVDSTGHWFEELVEFDLELLRFMGTHDENLFDDLKLELVDVVANLFAVASCLDIDLGQEMLLFADGCPECKSKQCKCTFHRIVDPCGTVAK